MNSITIKARRDHGWLVGADDDSRWNLVSLLGAAVDSTLPARTTAETNRARRLLRAEGFALAIVRS